VARADDTQPQVRAEIVGIRIVDAQSMLEALEPAPAER
jgi:hypothetical protein